MDHLDALFLVLNYSILPPWMLLIFAPRWPWTQRVVQTAFIPVLLGVAYTLLLFSDPQRSPEASFLTLDGVVALFSSRQATLAGWTHILVLDLFTGAWEVRDARRRGIPHLHVVPLLFVTLALAPLGLALYLGLRALRKRALTLDEGAAAAPS